MILHSTLGKSEKVSFARGIVNGLAPDGGLYLPDTLPRLPKALFNNIAEMSAREIGYVVMTTLLGDIIPPTQLKQIVDDALNFDIPVRTLSDDICSLELFHGPTMSFNDIGARFMARLLPLLDPAHGLRRDIILATSGDSGGAVANGFERSASTRVVVVYPRRKLSPEQITQFAGRRNVLAIEVDGNFDICQSLVKQILLENAGETGDRRVTSGNSINLLRQLPAIIYYFYGYAAMQARFPETETVISVPCGNLGNMTAALMAKQMGLPVKRFIAANNANDVFVEYLRTGGMRPRRALMTLASALDVGNPSNLARIIDMYGDDLASLRKDVSGVALTDAAIAATMKEAARTASVILDPQTAAAYGAARRELKTGEKGLVIASTHPAKFRDAVTKVLGEEFAIPRPVRTSHNNKSQQGYNPVIKIPPTIAALRRALETQ